MLSRIITGLLFLIGNFFTSQSGATSIATWNLEWLSSANKPVSELQIPQRSNSDIVELRRIFSQLSPDILAFQEVNDLEAIKNVVGDQYRIFLSDRSSPRWNSLQFDDINQFTGFAVRASFVTHDPEDIQLTKNRKLRFASYLKLKVDGKKEIHLLSVHLKSGCFGKWKSTKESCTTLKQQGEVLAKWIKSRTTNQEPFIILGDFNHNLSYPNDWLWTVMTSGIPSAILATGKTPATCQQKGRNGKLFRYRNLIDHIIVSADLSLSSPHQYSFSAQQLNQYQLSDHCPLVSTLRE